MNRSVQLAALIATRFLGGVAFQFFIVAGIDSIFRESASAFVTGLIGAVLFVPSLFAPMASGRLLGGSFKPGRLLVATQVGVVLTSAGLCVAPEKPWLIVAAAFVFGVLRAIRSPLQYALMGELRDKGLRTARAARVMSLSWQLPLVVGPLIYSLGTTLGERAQFPWILLGFNALSLLATTPFLLARHPVARTASAWSVRQTIRTFLANREVAMPLLADAALNMLLGFTTLLPFLLADIALPSSDLGLLRAALNASSLAIALLTPRALFDATRPVTFYVSLPVSCVRDDRFRVHLLVFTHATVERALRCGRWLGRALPRSALMRLVNTRELPAVASVQQVLISASDDLGEWRAGALGEALGPRVAMVVSAGVAGLVGVMLLRTKSPLPKMEYEVAWNRDSSA